MTTWAEITALTQFTGTQILADHPGGLRARELWPLVAERISAVQDQGDNTGKSYQNFQWYSVGQVKAGYITKRSGVWRVTPVGRAALSRHPSPDDYYQQTADAYSYWNQNRGRFDQLKRLVEAVPAGSWVSAAELAEQTGLDEARLVQWLQGDRPEGWHRVLDDGGHVPAHVHADAEDRHGWLTLLGDDGVDTSQGRAASLQRISVADLGGGSAEEEPTDARACLIRGSYVQGENLIQTLWLPDGICSLPASRLRDLPAGSSAEQVRAAIETDYSHANTQDQARLTGEYHAFLSRMHSGDIVVTNDGSAVYIGVVTGAPFFVSSVEGRANLQRTVDWRNAGKPLDYVDDLPDEFSAKVSNPDAELIELTEFLEDLRHLIGEDEPVPSRDLRLPDVPGDVADRLLVDREWLQECVELLRDRPQLIFYGPPGTGKTYLAQHLAEHLTGGKPENVQLVQFHPAYSYEDFFEGFRPKKDAGGVVSFDIVRGPLRRLAAAASAHPGEPYVLIIDEINRGNLAKIFGELYFLLEYRAKAVNLLYGSDEGKGFSLPRNLVILGTMNTADRSIALVDAAMRRRFWFLELHPDEPPTRDMLGRWMTREGHTQELAGLLTELNSRIDDRDFRIGPSYFMRPSATTDQGLRRIWHTQILPLLEEHHYGDGTDVKQKYGLDALRAGLG